MKNIFDARRQLAENGIELTPNEVENILKDLKKLHRRFARQPDFSQMTLWDKQKMCRECAIKGMEISPDELEQYLEIMAKIQQMEF